MIPPPATETRSYHAADGAELAYVAHLPSGGRRRAFVYLHGIESHAGWFADAARLLNEVGFPVFCLDRRGSGLNRESRGRVSGHVERGVDLLDDLHHAIRHIRAGAAFDAIYLMGLSWGGKYALAYDVRHPGEFDGLVLITPGIKPKVDLGMLEKLAIVRDRVLSPERLHQIPIEPEMFTTTPRHLSFIKNDPLRLHAVSAAFLWQSHQMDKLLEHADDNSQGPILVFLAGRDRIIDNEATRRFFARLTDRPVTIIEYADQTHSIQLDAPERMVRDVIEWMGNPSAGG